MMQSIICDNCGTLNPFPNLVCQSCKLPLCGEVIDDADTYSSDENNMENSYSPLAISSSVYGVEIDGRKFEEAKNKLKAILARTKTNPELSKVNTSGGLFNLFPHNVTGEELNELTTQIQGYLIGLNSFDIDIVDQIGELYQTIDALDKDYIRKIVISLECAEKASQEAKEAEIDAQKALKETNRTVNNLAATQKSLQKAQSDLRNANERIDATVTQLGKTILVLSKFKSEIDKIQHLEDLDNLWSDYQSSKKTISEINQNIHSIAEKLEQYSNNIDTLLQWKNSLDSLNHITEIDELWNDCVELKQHILSGQQSIDKMTEMLNAQEQTIQTLSAYINEMKQHEHLKDIDDVWKKHTETGEKLKQTELTISSQQDQIDELKTAISDIQCENKEKMSLAKKLTIAYALSGASLCIALVELVLLLLR